MLRLILVALLLQGTQVRFGSVILNDMVAGFAGDRDAFERAMTALEKLIAQNPDNAEALVWHGAGTLIRPTLENETDGQKRIASFQKGTSEMDRAVKLEPENIAVRIPRGAVLRMLTPFMPNFPILATLIDNARGDYQFAFDRQKDQLDQMGTHPVGELLQGLGDLYSRQGKTDDAQKYYVMIQERLKGTIYAERADVWLKTKKPLPPEQTACSGCHTAR